MGKLVDAANALRRATEDLHDAMEYRRSLGPGAPEGDRQYQAYRRCLIEAEGNQDEAWEAFMQWQRDDPELKAASLARVKAELARRGIRQ